MQITIVVEAQRTEGRRSAFRYDVQKEIERLVHSQKIEVYGATYTLTVIK
jgi:hypothetical protein